MFLGLQSQQLVYKLWQSARQCLLCIFLIMMQVPRKIARILGDFGPPGRQSLALALSTSAAKVAFALYLWSAVLPRMVRSCLDYFLQVRENDKLLIVFCCRTPTKAKLFPCPWTLN